MFENNSLIVGIISGLVCGVFGIFLQRKLTKLALAKFLKENDEIIEHVFKMPVMITFWWPFFLGLFIGMNIFSFFIFYGLDITFGALSNMIYLTVISIVAILFYLFIISHTFILTNKRFTSIYTYKFEYRLGITNIFLSEIKSIELRDFIFIKFLVINQKNDSEFSYGAFKDTILNFNKILSVVNKYGGKYNE